MAAAITFLQSNNRGGTTGTSHTFSGENLGTASADRIIFCAVSAENQSGTLTDVTSMTIAGVSATKVLTIVDTGNDDLASIWWANVTSGTSGDVVVNFDATVSIVIGLFLATGIGTAPTAHATSNDVDDALSLNLNVPEQGILLACGAFENDGAVTTVGVTENYDVSMVAFGFDRGVGGCAGPIAAETPRTVSFDGAAGNAAGVAASFAADGGGAAGQPTSKRHGGVPFMASPGRGNVWAPVFNAPMLAGPSSSVRKAA